MRGHILLCSLASTWAISSRGWRPQVDIPPPTGFTLEVVAVVGALPTPPGSPGLRHRLDVLCPGAEGRGQVNPDHSSYGEAARSRPVPQAHGRPTAPAAVRRGDLDGYLADLLTRFRAATALSRYRSLHRFFAWLVAEAEVPASPMARMRPPKVTLAPPDVLTPEEFTHC